MAEAGRQEKCARKVARRRVFCGARGARKDERYPVRLAWTPCRYGGARAWFVCLTVGCGRRVAILYGGGIFACRHCYRLAFASQREGANDRALRRADTIRRRLGWKPGILNGLGNKPKGMHWRTFERLTSDHEAFAERSLAGMMQWLGITQRLSFKGEC